MSLYLSSLMIYIKNVLIHEGTNFNPFLLGKLKEDFPKIFSESQPPKKPLIII